METFQMEFLELNQRVMNRKFCKTYSFNIQAYNRLIENWSERKVNYTELGKAPVMLINEIPINHTT